MRNQIACGFLIVLAACNGTRTGNPFDDGQDDVGTDEVGGGRCEAKTSALDSLGTDTALGFSAEDVLAFAEGEHATLIRWHAMATPEMGEHDLVVRITRSGDTAKLVTYTEAKPSDDDIAHTDIGLPEQDCSALNAIEIAVDVELRSDGGALDENVTGKLRARSTDLATVELSIDTDDLQGSLQFMRPAQGGAMVTAQTFLIGLSVSPLGLRGNVSDTYTTGSGPGAGVTQSATGRGGSIAVIGAAGCDDGGFAVDLDHELHGFAAQDALDRINDLPKVQATWRDGSSTTLDMELVHDGQAACAIVEGDSDLLGEASGFLRLYGTLILRSADDRLDAHWPVVMQARPDADGELGDIDVTFDTLKTPARPIDDLESAYGIHGIDVSAFDDASVRFELQIVGDTGEFAATLIVSGITQPMCPPPPDDPSQGAPGCRGADFTELESATFTAE